MLSLERRRITWTALAAVVASLLLPPSAPAQEAGPPAGPGEGAADDLSKVLEAAESELSELSEDKVFGAESDPKAVEIVERYLQSIGGRETLAAIQDRIAKFRNIKYSATGTTEAVIALFVKRGHKYREEWEIKGFKIKDMPLAFVQIYNGDVQEGWVKMLGTVSPLEGRTLSVFVWDKYIDDFFVNWESDGYSLRLAGAGLVEDAECDIVNCVDFTGRQQLRYFFSREDGRLLKKEWFDTTGKQTVKKEQFYKLYREIPFGDESGKKILFPLKLEIFVDGDLDTERIYTQVKFNDQLSDKLFEKPEGKPFEGGIRGRADLEARALEAARDTATGAAEESSAPHGVRTRPRRGSRAAPAEGSKTLTPPTREAEGGDAPEDAGDGGDGAEGGGSGETP